MIKIGLTNDYAISHVSKFQHINTSFSEMIESLKNTILNDTNENKIICIMVPRLRQFHMSDIQHY